MKRNTDAYSVQVMCGICIAGMLAGCATGGADFVKDAGTMSKPYEIVLSGKPETRCFRSDRIGWGESCGPHVRTLCVEPGDWIRWTGIGLNDIESIEFKAEDPLDRDSCTSDRRSYSCPVRPEARAGQYAYSVGLKGCETHDPKIIITNKKRPQPS